MQMQVASDAYVAERLKILKSYFQDLVDVVSESGLDIGFPDMLRHLAISPEDIRDGAPTLTFDKYFRLLGAVDKSGQLPGFGLELGARKTISCFGIYGYAMLSSTTYAHFSLVAKRIFRSIYDVVDLTAQVDGGKLVFTYEILLPPRFGFVPLMEHMLACGVSLMRGLMPAGVSWADCEIHFTFPPPEYLDLYPGYLPCKVLFDQLVTQLRVPEHWRQIRLTAGDEFMAEVCEQQFKRMLDGTSGAATLAERIRRILLNTRSNSLPKLGKMARSFHMAERTLRHQLARENTSYRELVTEVRMTQARRYLQESILSIQEIAYLLGYAQLQNFYRSFSKSVGMTPEQFRREANAGIPLREASGGG